MSVTILIPTYNRSKFSLLCAFNINHQTYQDIKEVIIMDDGNERLDIEDMCVYPVRYVNKKEHMTIGQKRNALVKMATTKYVAFMDDDDIYYSGYIEYSVGFLQSNPKWKIVGSTEMTFYFHNKQSYGAMSCSTSHLVHEATIVAERKFLTKHKFQNTSASEGKFLKDFIQYLGLTNINGCMCCLVHGNNTISKNRWYDESKAEYYASILAPKIKNHLELISNLNL